MNGWTPTIPLKTRLTNLIEQIPQGYRNDVVAQCVDENPHTTERNLSGVVLGRVWENKVAADLAHEAEKAIDEDLPYPMVFRGEADEVAPYRPAILNVEDTLPF